MPATENQTELRMTHRFDAPRERVFEAWTNPDVLKQWWAAGPDWEGVDAQVDVRPGGRIRLSMRAPDGAVHTGGGEYTEVAPPERLVYSWQWETEGDSPEGLVAVDFREVGEGTEVVLVHSGLASEDSRAAHEEGWRLCLENLGRRVLAGGG